MTRSILILTVLFLAMSCQSSSDDHAPPTDHKITFDNGGYIYLYIYRGIKYSNGTIKEPLIIDGGCYSACTLMADYARPNVCITSKGVLYFHKGRTETGERIDNLPYNDDLKVWIDKQGGLPAQGWLKLSGEELFKFFKRC